MINIHIVMIALCLSSMTFITWLYVKPVLTHDFNDPMQNLAPTASVISTRYYYAEDLINPDKLILEVPNLIGIGVLIGCLYVLLVVCSLANRQRVINGGVT